MRNISFVAVLVICVGLEFRQNVTAQSAARPTIHNVTLQEGSGVLTVTGTGLGSDLVVTVDGQPVTVLLGATATQVEVLAPATLLTTPGTYRLTVMDRVRQVGDAFVVASPAGNSAPVVAVSTGMRSVTPATRLAGTSSSDRAGTINSRLSGGGAVPLAVIEDSGAPYRTALGFQALFSNTSGNFNTATGYQALRSNTEGFTNTASGDHSLYSNTTGFANTASGSFALHANTMGLGNIASGAYALAGNTEGHFNTALGTNAGISSTTGSYNLFLGADVAGTAADTNTIRIGLPFNGGQGQNQTFIAGIHGTELGGSGIMPVYVNANGQLGMMSPQVLNGSGTVTGGAATTSAVAQLQQQVRDQQQLLREQKTTNAELRARLARLEALLLASPVRK